jgi:hypothetical protein
MTMHYSTSSIVRSIGRNAPLFIAFLSIPMAFDIFISHHFNLFPLFLRPMLVVFLFRVQQSDIEMVLLLISIHGFGALALYKYLVAYEIHTKRVRRIIIALFGSITTLTVSFYGYQLYYYSISIWHIFSLWNAIFYGLLIGLWVLTMYLYCHRISHGNFTVLTSVLAFCAVIGFLSLAIPYIMAGTWAFELGDAVPQPFPFGPFFPENR